MNYALNFDNFRNIAISKYDKNFTFIVGDKKFETSRIIADLLSPIINAYHYSDECINEFTINPSSQNDDYFEDFLKLPESEKVELDSNHIKSYSEYFLQLGNTDEFLKLHPAYFEDLTSENIIDRLQFFTKTIAKYSPYGSSSILALKKENYYHKLIDFASEHFYELERSKIKTIDYLIFEEILKNDRLQIESEDLLLETVLEMYEEDPLYSNLFEYIQFANLNEETIKKFIDVFSIEFLTEASWKSICMRLIEPLKKNKKQSNRYRQRFNEIRYNPQKELNGIMKYLIEKTGGNIHDNGTINISSNSIFGSNYEPKNLVDYDQNNYYNSNNDNDIYIRFDFKKIKIQPENYSIKSYPSGQGSGHLRSWVIEVSNDCNDWKIIDQHSNDSTLNNYSVISTFNIKKLDSFYQYIQIRQTGQSWRNDNIIYFPSIEFYGNFIEAQ